LGKDVKPIIVDSFYVVKQYKEESLIYLNGEIKTLSRIYFCNTGKENLVSFNRFERRSQENWPKIEKGNSKIYGKKIGNIIYLRQELTKEFVRKGLVGPIFWIILMTFASFILFRYKYQEMKW